MKIKLIVEDFYGVDFLKNVIERLKEANLVNKNLIIPKPKHIPADCNKKLDEILKIFDNTCDKIIIVFDADGPQNYTDKYEKAQSHIPNSMKTPVKIVLVEYEIEEWICIRVCLKIPLHGFEAPFRANCLTIKCPTLPLLIGQQ